MITKTIETLATSRADDLAFRALADVATLTRESGVRPEVLSALIRTRIGAPRNS